MLPFNRKITSAQGLITDKLSASHTFNTVVICADTSKNGSHFSLQVTSYHSNVGIFFFLVVQKAVCLLYDSTNFKDDRMTVSRIVSIYEKRERKCVRKTHLHVIMGQQDSLKRTASWRNVTLKSACNWIGKCSINAVLNKTCKKVL